MRWLLPLLLLPAIGYSQDAADPVGLGYESATESHRGLDSEPVAVESDAEGMTPSDDRAGETDTDAALPESGTAVKPAGDMPMPVDPDAAQAPPAKEEAMVAGTSSGPSASFEYDSVLEDYESYEEADGPGWIESNDTVGKIGGWRTYARELYESTDDEGDTE